MESKALASLFGDDAGLWPVVHPFKAEIGHTLGAAGVLETLALAAAIERQVAPAAAGAGELDAEAPARLLPVATPLTITAGLKLSAAFGGANASLALERVGRRASPAAKPRRPVYLLGFAHASSPDVARIAAASGHDADKIARADALSLLLATAIAGLDASKLAGGGIIVGHGLATIDINDRFYQRVLAKGPTAAEPRVFPPTSPNLMPGQVAIYFGLTGPSAALASGVGGALQPLDLAAELVAAGDADSMVAASVDVFGSASQQVLAAAFPGVSRGSDGAVAALLAADPAGALARVELDREGRGLTHETLLAELEQLVSAR
jgi:3-oxoacyl-[acyl-carrier-protein] synthase-1/3-oxoacyl-[acyl-carrier-protein] synthase II